MNLFPNESLPNESWAKILSRMIFIECNRLDAPVLGGTKRLKNLSEITHETKPDVAKPLCRLIKKKMILPTARYGQEMGNV